MAWTIIYRGECAGCKLEVEELHEEHGLSCLVWSYCAGCEAVRYHDLKGQADSDEEGEELFFSQKPRCRKCGGELSRVEWGKCPRCGGVLTIHE